MFVLGLMIFGAASLIAALAPGYATLIAMRFLKGVGGAIVAPAGARSPRRRAGHGRDRAGELWADRQPRRGLGLALSIGTAGCGIGASGRVPGGRAPGAGSSAATAFLYDSLRLVGLSGMLFAAAASLLIEFVLLTYLQQMRGWTPFEMAASFLPFALALIGTAAAAFCVAAMVALRVAAGRRRYGTT